MPADKGSGLGAAEHFFRQWNQYGIVPESVDIPLPRRDRRVGWVGLADPAQPEAAAERAKEQRGIPELSVRRAKQLL